MNMRLIRSVQTAIPAVAACLLLAHASSHAAPPAQQPPTAISKAWEFTDVAGTSRRIDWEARGSGAVIVFSFDLQQPDSLLGLNFFEALSTRAADFGLRVVGVEATGLQPDEVRAAMQGFTAVYRTPSFPIVADPDGAVARLFGSLRAPASLLVGEHGVAVASHAAFDLGTAVDLTRSVERLLKRDEGYFSPALRAVGVGEEKERQLSIRAAQAAAAEGSELRALAWGDRLPTFEFTDATGRPGRWAWPAGGVIRVAFFWSAASPDAAGVLTFFEGLRRGDGGEFLEMLAVEASGLDAGLVKTALGDRGRTGGSPVFPVVPDPQRLLVGLFGAGDPLPQTFLIDGRGDVLYRADGFGQEVRATLEEKITRAARLAGLGLPLAPNEVARPAAAGTDGGEAPSVSKRLERDKELRFNLSRGDYFFINGQHERGLTHYLRYLELEPGSLHALVRLAQSYDLLGNPDQAREWWQRVLAVSPAHGEGLRRLNQPGRGAGR